MTSCNLFCLYNFINASCFHKSWFHHWLRGWRMQYKCTHFTGSVHKYTQRSVINHVIGDYMWITCSVFSDLMASFKSVIITIVVLIVQSPFYNELETCGWTRGCLNIYMRSYKYRNSHYKDKTVSQPSYLCYRNSHYLEILCHHSAYKCPNTHVLKHFAKLKPHKFWTH